LHFDGRNTAKKTVSEFEGSDNLLIRKFESSKGQTICHREIPGPAITAALDRETMLRRIGLLYDVRL